jgi:hypothetical protein
MNIIKKVEMSRTKSAQRLIFCQLDKRLPSFTLDDRGGGFRSRRPALIAHLQNALRLGEDGRDRPERGMTAGGGGTGRLRDRYAAGRDKQSPGLGLGRIKAKPGAGDRKSGSP